MLPNSFHSIPPTLGGVARPQIQRPFVSKEILVGASVFSVFGPLAGVGILVVMAGSCVSRAGLVFGPLAGNCDE